MKILLVGEYSNVHWTLAEGLRALGHEVTVVSDGDVWKNFRRDIDIRRRSLGKFDTMRYLWRLRRLWPRLKGYDIVQLINPVFLDLRAERIWPYYEQLRRQNRKMVLGAFGIDYYWVLEGMKPDTFRYSDFYLDGQLRHNRWNDGMVSEWLNGAKGALCQRVANDCDHIVSGLYEYDICYKPHFPDKTTFIPYPIVIKATREEAADRLLRPDGSLSRPIRFFIGIQKTRHEYKGTDVMLRALERLKADYPDRVDIVRAENVPYETYQHMIEHSDVLLDQLYSYTPAMNGLLAMARGMVLVGGGEEEHYQLLDEPALRPIVNVTPSEADVNAKLEQLVLHPEELGRRQRDGLEFVGKHHDHVEVARRYAALYDSILHD